MSIIKQLLAVFLGALLVQPLSANIQSGMQWDVRTTGADTNGGGFDPTVTSPGTDYSQQASAQVAFTDLIIGSTTTQLTSVLDAFGATSPGNVINITGGSGCTTGWFEILSVSGSTATMDRAVGTAASVCTGNLGGSFATPAQGITQATASTVALGTIFLGNTVNVKAGTYTQAALTTIDNSYVALVTVLGYSATHGDGGTKPLITESAGNNLFNTGFCGTSPCRIVVNNVSMSTTAGSPGDGFLAFRNNGPSYLDLVISNSKMDGFRIAVNGDYTGYLYNWSALYLLNTEIVNTTTYCASNGRPGPVGVTYVVNSYLHNSTGTSDCLVTQGVELFVINSVIAANGGSAITPHTYPAALVYVINSDLSLNGGSGVTGENLQILQNSIMYGNGAYGINAAGVYPTAINQNNAYGANTSGDRNNLAVGTGDVSLSANPFTSSSNFALNATAGGGAALKAHGTPGLMPAGTGYIDIGALQSQCTGGGGGSPTGCAFSSLRLPAHNSQ
ncbi:MAG: hypothetical protein ACLPND_21210 [Candidatus Korobacteraceae bacterium]